jgi:hypothetical protein
VGPRAVLDAVVKRKIPSPPVRNRTLERRSSSPEPSAIPTELPQNNVTRNIHLASFIGPENTVRLGDEKISLPLPGI